MRPWVKDLHASPLNYPKKLFVESMANIHTDNVYPERHVLRRLGLGIRPLTKFDVVDTLEQHKNPSNTVRRWWHVEGRRFFIGGLWKESESDIVVLQEGG